MPSQKAIFRGSCYLKDDECIDTALHNYMYAVNYKSMKMRVCLKGGISSAAPQEESHRDNSWLPTTKCPKSLKHGNELWWENGLNKIKK